MCSRVCLQKTSEFFQTIFKPNGSKETGWLSFLTKKTNLLLFKKKVDEITEIVGYFVILQLLSIHSAIRRKYVNPGMHNTKPYNYY